MTRTVRIVRSTSTAVRSSSVSSLRYLRPFAVTRAVESAERAAACHSSSAGSDARPRIRARSWSSRSPERTPVAIDSKVLASSTRPSPPIRRGTCRGSPGVRAVATAATAAPTSASVQRPSPPPVDASGRPMMTIAWTPAWVVMSAPRSMNRAMSAESPRTRPICHAPVPIRPTSTSPRPTPRVTPIPSSMTRRTSRSAVNRGRSTRTQERRRGTGDRTSSRRAHTRR